MKTRILLLVIIPCVLFFSCQTGIRKEKHVLVYTKNGVGFIHECIPASVEMLKKIGEENGIIVDVSEDPSVFTEENLGKYSALIFSNTNNDIFNTNEQKIAFVRYIQAGGGFVGIHSACGSERQWPLFWAMLGGKFVRHPPGQEYNLKIIDSDHQSTRHLGNIWEWNDEPYLLNYLNPDIHVVLAIDYTTVEDNSREVYPANIFGDLFPAAWKHEFDGGRQFYTALGHHPEHYSDPNYIKHVLGGIEWAIGDNRELDYTKAYTQELGTNPPKAESLLNVVK